VVGVEVAGRVGAAVFEDFVEAFLDGEEFVCLQVSATLSRIEALGGRRDIWTRGIGWTVWVR
jgi:hypothetical protein